MAQVQLSGGGNNSKYDEDELRVKPLRFALKHKGRYNATIGFISEIYERDAWGDDAGKEEVFQLYTYVPLNELDLDDEKQEAVAEQIEQHRQAIEEANEKREDIGWDTLEQIPDGHIPMKMYLRPSLTRTTQSGFNNAKLYDTLFNLDLAEGIQTENEDGEMEDQGAIQLYDRHGEEENPFNDIDMERLQDLSQRDNLSEKEHEEYKQLNEEVNDALTNYLRQNLLAMEVEIEVKNANRDKPGKDEYSTVKEIIEKVNDPEADDE